MNIATHCVEVPFPQAFASPLKKRSPFPSAPGTVAFLPQTMRLGTHRNTIEFSRCYEEYSTLQDGCQYGSIVA